MFVTFIPETSGNKILTMRVLVAIKLLKDLNIIAGVLVVKIKISSPASIPLKPTTAQSVVVPVNII